MLPWLPKLFLSSFQDSSFQIQPLRNYTIAVIDGQQSLGLVTEFGIAMSMIRSIIFFVWSCLCAVALLHLGDSVVAQSPNNCLECHSRQKDEPGAVVAIYKTSTHYRAALGCDDCHGGDSSQPEKGKAHAGRFIAGRDTAATLEMCGRCHREPLEFF